MVPASFSQKEKMRERKKTVDDARFDSKSLSRDSFPSMNSTTTKSICLDENKSYFSIVHIAPIEKLLYNFTRRASKNT